MGEAAVGAGVAQMPRGGPNASWLDRRLQTHALEYTDRYDIDDEVKQEVVSALAWMGSLARQHEKHAQAVLELVRDVPNPRILELGAGHGMLSAKIVELHSTATVTVSDLDPTSVANIAASELGSNPRVRTMVVDATAIDAEDDSYDLVVFALAFHHLPPAIGARAIAEATRVGRRFLVIDLKRGSPAGLIVQSLAMTPVAAAMMAVRPKLRHVMHDGIISALRAYSPAALAALGKAADPRMSVEFPTSPSEFGPRPVSVVFSRPVQSPTGPGCGAAKESPLP